jgi:hypothetical protein
MGYVLFTYWNNLGYADKTKHETERWAVIVDTKNDIIAVEITNPSVWLSLERLNENQTEMWIGGIVEIYDNYWGFRFKPDTIVIAEITIEGAQSTIQGISGDLNYWINVWTKEAYVLAKVVEIHE